MDYTINLTITDQSLSASNIVSVNGTVDIIGCTFDFDATWDAFPARQAIFKNSNDTGAYVAAIGASGCIVPWEVLKKAGVVYVAVVGTNTDGQVQRTNTIMVVCQTRTLQGGVNGIEPTPDQYAQFIAQVEEIIGQAGVLSVNGMTGDVTLAASDVGALPDTYSAPVSSVNNKTGAVTLTASDVGALPDSMVIPSRTSQLTNDSGFLSTVPSEYVTETELASAIAGKANTADLAAVASSGSYNDLLNKPTIPTKTSQLTNNSNFVSDANYVHTDNNYTAAEKSKLAGIETGAEVNDVTSVNGQTGAVVLDADDVGALPDNTTASDLGAYVKPSGGIPKSDLASAVQTSLNKADTALQSAPVTSVNGRTGAVTGLEEETVVQTMTSSDTSVTLQENKFYVFPEMTTLTVTVSATGMYQFRFESGATATTLTVIGATMPDSFTVEANKVYEINIYQGYGVATSWTVS